MSAAEQPPLIRHAAWTESDSRAALAEQSGTHSRYGLTEMSWSVLHLLEDLLEWHPIHFGITWTDFFVGLALLAPFLWMLRVIFLEIIKTHARTREHDNNIARSFEVLRGLSAKAEDEEVDGIDYKRKKDN